jgi:hypothetical protein
MMDRHAYHTMFAVAWCGFSLVMVAREFPVYALIGTLMGLRHIYGMRK